MNYHTLDQAIKLVEKHLSKEHIKYCFIARLERPFSFLRLLGFAKTDHLQSKVIEVDGAGLPYYIFITKHKIFVFDLEDCVKIIESPEYFKINKIKAIKKSDQWILKFAIKNGENYSLLCPLNAVSNIPIISKEVLSFLKSRVSFQMK